MEKKQILRCNKCHWQLRTTGLSKELEHLHEFKNCPTCGVRKFRCPKCGQTVKLMKLNARRG